jgi:MFS family permease
MSEAAIAQVHPEGPQGFFAKHRTLDTYPTGAYRWALLVLTLVATLLIYYDLGFAGILPLWMASLHFTAKQFGVFLTCAVVLSGTAGLIGGPLADRHGRVVVIDACLVAQLILSFANLLMTGFWSFVLVRGLMFLVAGVGLPATSGLIRDFTPRLGRATGYAMVGIGSVASQWMWTFVPGITLSHFHTWQSQIWIMSFFGIALFIPSVLWLKDLHPSIRNRIIESESSAMAVQASREAVAVAPKSARTAFAELLSGWQIWAIVVGSAFMITVPITIQTYGPLIFVQAFKYTPAEASKMASYFFLLQTLAFLPGGLLSDYLRIRKAMSLVMTVLMASLVAWWATTFAHPLSPLGLGIVCGLLGMLWDFSYVPWAAFYSEYLEDVAPALQATGWSFFHAMFRFWLAAAGMLQPVVAQHYGWSAWIWIVAMVLVIYIFSLLVVPGYWGRSTAMARARPAVAH